MNGTPINPKMTESRDDWLIVFDGPSGYIGKPVGPAVNDFFKLQPAFEYLTQPVFEAVGQGQINVKRQRMIIPLEGMPALNVAVTIRKGRFYRLGDFSEKDREIYNGAIDAAFKMAEQLKAQQSNIALVGSLPPGLTPPRGRS